MSEKDSYSPIHKHTVRVTNCYCTMGQVCARTSIGGELMYIEFDGYFEEHRCVMKAPKVLSHTQIKHIFQQAMDAEGRENVIVYFTRQFGFKRVENAEGIQPFCVIDLDTDRVYCPYY